MGITLNPSGTVEAKGILKKTPNHYKRVNIVVDDLTEGQCCREIAIAHQLQILKPGLDRIPVILQNLSSRTLKLKKGTNVAHAEASQVVPSLDSHQCKRTCVESLQGILQRTANLRTHLGRMMTGYQRFLKN